MEVNSMCLNCGCGMPDDDMGNPDNITAETVKKAAKASGMSVRDTVGNLKVSLTQLDVDKLEEEG